MLLLLLLPLCFIIPGDGLVLPEEEDLLNMLLPAGHNNGPDAKILPKDMDVGVNKMDEIYRVMGTIVNQLSQKIYQLGVDLKLMVSISQDFGTNNGVFFGQTFLSLHKNTTRTALTYPGCSQSDTESCVRADVNLDLLQNGDFIELPDGMLLKLSSRGDNSAVFQSEGCEAVFTWHGDNVVGSVHVEGQSWILQGCGEKCFLWIKHTGKWKEESLISSSSTRSVLPPQTPFKLTDLMEQGEADSDTMVTYSVMIWYTPQFRSTFSSDLDMMTFIDLIFTLTNQGYINSEIPLTVLQHDVQLHPTLNDIQNSSLMLDAFSSSMPLADLLNCADSTALLIEEFSSCGIAYTDTAFSCGAISVTMKNCSTGYYSFGHEIGHNFGARHNPEQNTLTTGDGYGHLILPTSSNEILGYRTILAYNAFGHKIRVNHYSNPEVTYNNSPTGVVSISNNARLITANRFAMASCGTEEPNGECNDCSVNPANEPCLNCCETVTISSADSDFLAHSFSFFAGSYTKYSVTPSLNGRMVYKHNSGAYCLYFASSNNWVINSCSKLGSTRYFLRTDAINKQCVHASGLSWVWWSGEVSADSTMTAECSVVCSDDPPAAPSGATSDWDGTTKTAGTIITYSCSSSSATKKATCDPATTSWTPAFIPANLCVSVPLPMTTTTSEAAMSSTTTTSVATMSSTTSLNDCGIRNKVTILKTMKKIMKVGTAFACRKMCEDYSDCQYFNWKTHRRQRKRTCWLQKVGYKNGKGYTSGPVHC